MININKELETIKSELDEYSIEFINEYGGYLESNSYICDLISEFADSNTSIYYNDIVKYISENVEQVNDTAQEFGVDQPFDLYKLGQQAEYMSIFNSLYNDSDDIILCLAYDYILTNLRIEELNEEQNNYIEEITEEVDTGGRLCEVLEYICNLSYEGAKICE